MELPTFQLPAFELIKFDNFKIPSSLEDLTLSTVLPCVAVVGVSVSCIRWLNNRRRLPLPPGPKPLPLVGNLFQIPADYPWETYNEWREKYGDVIYLEALGSRMLVLNSLEAVNDLMVGRAANYSNRGFSPVIEMIRFDWAFSLMHYGSVWREHRRLFHQQLNLTQMPRYHAIIEEEIAAFLPRLMADPENFMNLIRYALGGIIMRVSYGSDDYEYNQRLSVNAGDLVNGFMEYSAPGRLLVGMFPFLRHVPSWFPGAGWKRTLDKLGELSDEVIRVPFDDTKKRLNAGLQKDDNNMATQYIEKLPKESDPDYKRREIDARSTAAIAYAAGADTTVGVAFALVMGLAMNQEFQKRARDELDSVVGSDRLPTFADVKDLHCIQALVKEANRWHTMVPMSLPRVLSVEDTYRGYRIPANTLILPNSWAIMHDPAVFGSNAMEFRPDRYLKNGKIDNNLMDAESASFGYGRRICPGRHLSTESLTMMTANLLATFDVRQARDKQGVPIPLKLKFPSSLLTTPDAFSCDIRPRSKAHAELILNH